MIDFEEMKRRQEEGLKDIDSLQDDERDILKHYCSLSTEALMRLGIYRKAVFEEVVINAFRTGLALGLHLQVVAGEVRGR